MPLYTPVFFDRFEPNTTNFIFHDFGRNINPAKKKVEERIWIFRIIFVKETSSVRRLCNWAS